MNTILRLSAALALATPLASATIATASSAPPPPPVDRGLLGGPDVGDKAAEGRRSFGTGQERMTGETRGNRGERGERGAGRGMRRFAMLATAIRDAEPTPEQVREIRGYLGEVREKAQAFAAKHGEEMRNLVRVRRELVAEGGDLSEVDAEILALRTRFMEPGEILRNVQKRLDPEQRERFRASLEGQIRTAMERMREGRRGEMGPRGEMPMEPRRRGGRPEAAGEPGADAPRGRRGMGAGGGPVFSGSIEEVFEAELLFEAMRGNPRGEGGRMRGDRRDGAGADRPGRDRGRPQLDLDTPDSED